MGKHPSSLPIQWSRMVEGHGLVHSHADHNLCVLALTLLKILTSTSEGQEWLRITLCIALQSL